MNDNPTDISGTGGTGHQNAICPQFEVWVFVCIVDVRDDLLRVKQDHEIMRKEGDRVHLQFDVGEQYGTGFGHTHGRPQYAYVDCARLRPMVEACRLDRSGIFRDCRTDDPGVRKFGAQERIRIRYILGDDDSGHASDGLAKGGHKVGGLICRELTRMEMRDRGHRLNNWLIASNCVQNRVPRKRLSRVHDLTSWFVLRRCFLYHW